MLLAFGTVEGRPDRRVGYGPTEFRRERQQAPLADMRFVKPLDLDLVLKLAAEHEILITIEEGSIGGFGSHVMQVLAEHGKLDGDVKMRAMVLPDVFMDHDTPAAMYARAGLDAKAIVKKVFEALGKDAKAGTSKLA